MGIAATATSDDLVAVVSRARDGDEQAWSQLFDLTHGPVEAIVRRHVADPELVDDVVQEAYLAAHQQLDQLREPSSFVPWVAQIARNHAVDAIRCTRDVPAGDLIADEVDPSPTPAEWVEEMERSAIITGALRASLSDREATGLWLRDGQGVDVPTISARFGISPNHTSVMLSRARTAARAALSGVLSTLLGLRLAWRRAPAIVAAVAVFGLGVLQLFGVPLPFLHEPAEGPASGDVPTIRPVEDVEWQQLREIVGPWRAGVVARPPRLGPSDVLLDRHEPSGHAPEEHHDNLPIIDVTSRDTEDMPTWVHVTYCAPVLDCGRVASDDDTPDEVPTPEQGPQIVIDLREWIDPT